MRGLIFLFREVGVGFDLSIQRERGGCAECGV